MGVVSKAEFCAVRLRVRRFVDLCCENELPHMYINIFCQGCASGLGMGQSFDEFEAEIIFAVASLVMAKHLY